MFHQLAQRSIGLLLVLFVGVVAAGTAIAIALNLTGFAPTQSAVTPDRPEAAAVGANGQDSTQPEFEPRKYVDSSGFIQLSSFMPAW